MHLLVSISIPTPVQGHERVEDEKRTPRWRVLQSGFSECARAIRVTSDFFTSTVPAIRKKVWNSEMLKLGLKKATEFHPTPPMQQSTIKSRPLRSHLHKANR